MTNQYMYYICRRKGPESRTYFLLFTDNNVAYYAE